MAEDQEFTLPPLEERPLVTFALFAYNQEKYIREAVEGAFAQTYEPLEIILSDDCSTDRTFEIMEEMVASYKGPHEVYVQKNKENLGLIRHTNKIFSLNRNKVVIFAAGDDISRPDRTTKTVAQFQEDKKALAVHSKVKQMTIDGRVLDELTPPVVRHNLKTLDTITAPGIHIGATAAYRTEIISFFGEVSETDTYEDLILGFRAKLLNGLSFIDEPLVLYRTGVGISTQRKPNSYKERIQIRKCIISRHLATMRQRSRDCKITSNYTLQHAVDDHITALQMRDAFYRSPQSLVIELLKQRKKHALHAISAELKYCLGLIN